MAYARSILIIHGLSSVGVDDIKRKQEKQDDAMLHLSCELEAVKESTKSAHKRIDRLEENRIGVEHHE